MDAFAVNKLEFDVNETAPPLQSCCGSICTKLGPVFWLQCEWDERPKSARTPCLSNS